MEEERMMEEAMCQANKLAERLRVAQWRVVLAESCTGGWVSALLSSVPGISDTLCGSLVTYRQASKQAWLHVSEQTLANNTAESVEVTREMVVGALNETPEAQIAAAITGHVGPKAPMLLDGVCFIAVAVRGDRQEARVVWESREGLRSETRVERQQEAALLVLNCLLSVLDESE